MHDVLFNEPIPAAFKDDLIRRVYYISESIDDFELIAHENCIRGLRIQLRGNGEALDQAAAAVRAAVQQYRRKVPKLETHPIWSNSGARAYRMQAFRELTAHNEAFQTSPGLVALGERSIRIMDCFDRRITTMVKSCFDAREYRYPTLIPLQVMRCGGYIRSFPHLLMYVTRLHSDYNTYAAFMKEERLDLELTRAFADIELCLPPTMCYHTYQQFADSELSGPSTVVTAKGKSFRFESRYEKNLERLWDFTIREVVFIGSSAFVIDARKRLMCETFRLMEELGIAGFCQQANDPFFIDNEGRDDSLIQTLMELKYELRLNIAPDETIACASFNLHNDFLGRAFNIRSGGGDVARTACAGFGLERLTFAFLAQYGLDETNWPNAVRKGVAAEH